MIEYLEQLAFWDWLALGTLLLILEVFGAAGYLLWMGLAAVAVGILVYAMPTLAWHWQLLGFAFLALGTAILWWRYQRQHTGNEPLLNQRAKQLVGQDLILLEAIVDGRGKARVGDSAWLVTGPAAAAGSKVRVTAQQGVILSVVPVE